MGKCGSKPAVRAPPSELQPVVAPASPPPKSNSPASSPPKSKLPGTAAPLNSKSPAAASPAPKSNPPASSPPPERVSGVSGRDAPQATKEAAVPPNPPTESDDEWSLHTDDVGILEQQSDNDVIVPPPPPPVVNTTPPPPSLFVISTEDDGIRRKADEAEKDFRARRALASKTAASAGRDENTHASFDDIVEVPIDDIHATVTVTESTTSTPERASRLSFPGTENSSSQSMGVTYYRIAVVCRSTGAALQSVKVRFSQCDPVFQELKAIVGTRSSTLPDLPGKKTFMSILQGQSKAFVEERRLEIERFLQAVLSNKFLARHPKFLELLHVSEGAPARQATDVLRQWKMGPLLGRGAFGSVYMGLLPNSMMVAVKVVALDSSGPLTSDTKELLFLEALEHRNIVKYYGTVINSADRQLEMFTEYVEGGSVATVVQRFGKLSISVIRLYLRQILDALAYLHSKNIAHRDLKGDNLLVAKNGEIKLADFGCSKQLSWFKKPSSLVGTPMWMAPEVIRGEDAGLVADIWSVGCLVIEMLGREPWKTRSGENAYAIMFRVQNMTGPPDGIPTVKEVGPRLYDFLLKCFIRDPAMRPSAAQLAQHEFVLWGE